MSGIFYDGTEQQQQQTLQEGDGATARAAGVQYSTYSILPTVGTLLRTYQSSHVAGVFYADSRTEQEQQAANTAGGGVDNATARSAAPQYSTASPY